MLDKIKAQYHSSQVLVKQKHYTRTHTPNYSQMTIDLHPLCMDYYHELNPACLLNISRFDILDSFPAVTVRDGGVLLSSFILKHLQQLPKFKTHLIVREDLAKLIPPNATETFSAWRCVQPKGIKISEAKRLVVVGLAAEGLLPALERLMPQLLEIKHLPAQSEIDIYLPQKKNPFLAGWRENYLHYEIIETIKGLAGHRKINFINLNTLLGRTSYGGMYALDLLESNPLLADHFLNQVLASRGATISSFGPSHPEAVFELDLSLNHKLQILQLPKVDSVFSELLFYKKLSGARDPLMDPAFHSLIQTR